MAWTVAAAAALGLLVPGTAAAEPAVAVLATGAGNVLVSFDTASPSVLLGARSITGLQPGEKIAAVDVRIPPLAGSGGEPGLFALGVIEGATDQVRLYRLDAGTGATTLISPTPIAVPTATAGYGGDFDPQNGRLRVINDAGQNLRIEGLTGVLVANDVDLTTPSAALAFSNNDADPSTVTTGFVLQPGADRMARLVTPNSGTLADVGALGVNIAADEVLNFDISPTGAAYATATAGGLPQLYSANVSTGTLSLIGTLVAPVRAFAVLPASAVAFAAATVSTTESSGTTVTVTRSGALDTTVVVSYTVTGGTADTGDFEDIGSTLVFSPGEASETFAFKPKPDVVDEPDESLTIALHSPTAPFLKLASPSTMTLSLLDDDAPGSGGGGGGGGPNATPPDTTKPKLTFTGLPVNVTLAKLKSTGVKIVVKPDEAAALTVSLEGTPKSGGLKAYELTLATRTFARSTATRTVTLKPPRARVGSPTKQFRVRVKVVAVDAAGNQTTATRIVLVKPPKR